MKKGLKLTILLVLCVLISMGSVSVQAANTPAQVKKVKVTNVGKTKHKVTWAKIKGVSGYQVYCKDYSGASVYKRVATLSGAGQVSYTVTGRKQGKAYSYIVRAYKKVKGKKYYGKFSSGAYGYTPKTTAKTTAVATTTKTTTTTTSTSATVSTGLITNPTVSQKYKKVFGDSKLRMTYPGGYYKSATAAKKDMKEITVKTWDFKTGKTGTKITRTWKITVHKNLATTVQQVFKEIYEGKEKFPIHELGGYAWRGGHSEHNTGTAIDINWTENYMVNTKTGVITSGKYWRPGKDPYSIPKDGEVAKIFKKYGFTQGDWGDSKDYMHFSYFGT